MGMKKVVKIVKDDKGSLLINADGSQDYLEGVFAELSQPQAQAQAEEQPEGEDSDELLNQYMNKMKVE